MGRRFAIACASGSAAVHCAVAALEPAAGDEIVTTPITDMGAITPILFEGIRPVFADVDPDTLNVTAPTLAARLSPRTRALIVTHLFGVPCDMAPIVALAAARGLPIIEDVAQAFLAEDRAGMAGSFGTLAVFSLQQGKHMTCGEGGIVITDDEALARRVRLLVNKAWGYGDPKPDHYFPALNYRMTELQGAVALAQLAKLDGVVERRRRVAERWRELIRTVAGMGGPVVGAGVSPSWWRFALRVDDSIRGGAQALGERLQSNGVACVPNYIRKPAFECALFRDWQRFPVMAAAYAGAPPRERREDYPGAYAGLGQVLVLPVNEQMRSGHVEQVMAVVRSEAAALRDGRRAGAIG
jgi:dTDP-4-amino-4,6-dideoxygalactose transaminase